MLKSVDQPLCSLQRELKYDVKAVRKVLMYHLFVRGSELKGVFTMSSIRTSVRMKLCSGKNIYLFQHILTQ